jgi:hypothetical protein
MAYRGGRAPTRHGAGKAWCGGAVHPRVRAHPGRPRHRCVQVRGRRAPGRQPPAPTPPCTPEPESVRTPPPPHAAAALRARARWRPGRLVGARLLVHVRRRNGPAHVTPARRGRNGSRQASNSGIPPRGEGRRLAGGQRVKRGARDRGGRGRRKKEAVRVAWFFIPTDRVESARSGTGLPVRFGREPDGNRTNSNLNSNHAVESGPTGIPDRFDRFPVVETKKLN